MVLTSAPTRTERAVRVVLADDECLFRASLRQLLAVPASVIKDVYGVDVGAGFEVVGEAGSGEDTVRVVRSVRPGLLLLDLSMPRMSGLEALRELGTCRDGVRTILLAGTIDRTQLLTAVHLGVHGLLLKDVTTEVLFEAIMCVMAGRYWLGQTLVSDLLETVRPLIESSGAPGGRLAYGLTPRERQVLTMVASGVLQQGDRPAMRHQRADHQAPSHPHVRQARGLQPAGACDDRDRARPGPGF